MAHVLNDIVKLNVGEIRSQIICVVGGIHLKRVEMFGDENKVMDYFFNKEMIRYIYNKDDSRGPGLFINDRFFRFNEPRECLRFIVGTLFDKDNTQKLMIQTTGQPPIMIWSDGIFVNDKFLVGKHIISFETGDNTLKIFMPTPISLHKYFDISTPDPTTIMNHTINMIYGEQKKKD